MGEMAENQPLNTRRFPASWRLTFHFDEDGAVELARRQQLPMIAPGSPDPSLTGRDYSGSWVELQDRQGRVLFERVLHNPFRTTVEVHYPPGRNSQVVSGPRQAGEFEAVVPVIPEATTVVVWSSELDSERRNEAAREVGRFDLGQAIHQGEGG